LQVSELLEKEIAALPKMNLAQLQAKWRGDLKEVPPPNIRKQLLVPLLAYKLQERAYGGLKPEIKRRLRELAQGFNRNPQRTAAQLAGPLRIKPGTRMIREWDGQSHYVTAGEAGFEYNGENYKSLSAIARLITGTRWSGPLFFGLKGHR
jgi:hypothetical protein